MVTIGLKTMCLRNLVIRVNKNQVGNFISGQPLKHERVMDCPEVSFSI